jgi:hypothetical protein
MIQITSVPKNIKKVPFDRLYTIKTRQTYFGIHREIIRPDIEIGCTKSAILGFVKQRDAQRFKDLIVEKQNKKMVLDRHVQEGGRLQFVSQEVYNLSLNPIELESVPRLFLLYMCILHSMDIYVVDDFSKALGGIGGTYPIQWKMYCYESRMEHPANPEILTQLFL